MNVLQVTTVSDDEVNTLVAEIDTNNDGEVDFEEFFKAFAYGNIDLAVEELEV
jgi:Ca2+-binding EF-hand superfamily protein